LRCFTSVILSKSEPRLRGERERRTDGFVLGRVLGVRAKIP
jgi:hypothetical protein